MTQGLSMEELEIVAGGGSSYHGKCRSLYYEEDCAATVESGSWCGSNDYCIYYDVSYTCVGTVW